MLSDLTSCLKPPHFRMASYDCMSKEPLEKFPPLLPLLSRTKGSLTQKETSAKSGMQKFLKVITGNIVPLSYGFAFYRVFFFLNLVLTRTLILHICGCRKTFEEPYPKI